MIKINLLKDKKKVKGKRHSSGASASESDGFQFIGGGGNSHDSPISMLLKVIIMALGVLSLKYYEHHLEAQNKKAKNRAREEHKNEKNYKIEKMAQKNKLIAEEAELMQYDRIVKSMIDSTQGRLNLAKVLDGIYGNMAEGMWLRRVEFSPRQVFIEGDALSKNNISAFITNLSSYNLNGQNIFEQVQSLKEEEKTNNSGSSVYFKISSEVSL